MTSQRARRRLPILMLALSLLLGLIATTPASANTWREYTSGGRRWRERCEAYSSSVVRCRTEISATVAHWDGRRFTVSKGWTFNNLLYKPSPREDWAGNPLAETGEYTVQGRKWKTECDTSWTGRNGCRSQILAHVPHFDGRRYVFKTKWVFNNVVQFSTADTPPVIPNFPPKPRPDTVITNTTSAEVRYTHRLGCPVGPSNLRTIRINQWDMDGEVHRGEIIVLADLANKVADSFEKVFNAGFPTAQMRNPNEWNGSDEKMMAANNTSAFNCRRVVGNPSAMSPHSYGKAIDFNPVQNPYRDPNGKWWPSDRYVKRTPVVPGMHTDTTASVKAFKGNGFRWFKGWDYHHFEYPTSNRAALRAHPQGSASTTSGALDGASLSQPDGWQTDIREGSLEEGFVGNGTWVHAVDPATKGTDVLAVGCAPATTDAPKPIAALEGNLTADGKPGVSVAMQFGSEAEAQDYFAAWTKQKQACTGTTVTDLGSSGDTWLGRWDVDGSTWSEAGGQRDDTVKLTLLEADLDAPTLKNVAADF